MKNIIYPFAIYTALLFGCLLPVASQAKDNQKHHESGIIGQIVEMPGQWDIRIVSEKDKFIADIQANDSGSFEVDLKPGTYILTPYILSIDGNGALLGVSTTVVVHKKEFTTADLPIVHGPD